MKVLPYLDKIGQWKIKFVAKSWHCYKKEEKDAVTQFKDTRSTDYWT